MGFRILPCCCGRRRTRQRWRCVLFPSQVAGTAAAWPFQQQLAKPPEFGFAEHGGFKFHGGDGGARLARVVSAAADDDDDDDDGGGGGDDDDDQRVPPSVESSRSPSVELSLWFQLCLLCLLCWVRRLTARQVALRANSEGTDDGGSTG